MSDESSKCLVSVIIPTYGRPDYLKRALDSVLRQTYRPIEVIIIDDNNPDTKDRAETEKAMSEYADNAEVIYLRHEKNKNGSAARNTGIARSTGKYLCFLDDDDEMLPNRIELFVNKMESLDDSWGACYSNYVKLKENGVKDCCGEKKTGELYFEALIRSLYFCPGSNLFVRSSLAKQIGGFDEDFWRNQDIEFLARLLERCKLAFVDEITLVIHYENRVVKATPYEDMIRLDNFYLGKFADRIEKLPPKQRKKVYQYFALERFRNSIKKHRLSDGLKNCCSNKVSPWLFFRYLCYMGYRFVTKKSVGFRI